VYIYGATGNVWSRISKILPKDSAAQDGFGYGVSVYDATALIGAWNVAIGTTYGLGTKPHDVIFVPSLIYVCV
jgi:uncharacterized protein YbbC (DUF1343 family)